jgi:hypothetical protein
MRAFLRPLAALLACFVFATCVDSPTGPSLTDSRVTITIPPVATLGLSGPLSDFGMPNIDRVRAIVVRTTPDTAADTTIVLAAAQSAHSLGAGHEEITVATDIGVAPDGAITIDLPISLRLAGERFAFYLEYRNASGVVFRGEGQVRAHRADQPAPATALITVGYAGPGAQAVRITVSPKAAKLTAPASATFSAIATDSGGHAVTGVPVRWSVSDTTVASIDPLSGTLATTGKRGSVTVTARTITALRDSIFASITLPVATLTLVSGGNQVGKAGTVLPSPAVVLVAAADGVGLPGVTVNFSAPVGAAVGSASSVTDSSGKASTSFTIGTLPGPQNFTASAGALNVVIAESAITADVASIAIVSGDAQQDSVSAKLGPLKVRVTDAFNNPVGGVPVTWARTSGAGSLASATTSSGADGVATNTYSLGTTVGSGAVSASLGALSATFSFTATAASATRISLTNKVSLPTTTKSGAALDPQPEVRVLDQFGNFVPGALTVTAASTNGTIALNGITSVAVNAATGAAVFSGLSLSGSVGTTAIRFTASNGSISPDSTNAITLGVGTASQVIVTPPAGAPPAGYDFEASVRAADAGGNTVTGATGSVTLTLSGGAGSLSGTATRPLVNGIATFPQLRVSAASSTYVLTATNGSVVGSSAPFAISAPLVLSANPTGAQNVGAASATPIAPSVTITQSGLTPSTNYVVTFAAGASNGTISKGSTTNATTIAVTANSGAAALDSWVVPSAVGTYQLTASIDGTATSATFSATVADIHAMAFVTTPGSSQTSGSALSSQPVIQLTDGAGHNVSKSGVTVTASVAPAPGVSGATFSTNGTASATSDANGLITFSNLGITGTSGLAARVTFSVTAGTSQTIAALTSDVTLSAGAPTTVESNSPLAVSATVGNALSAGNYPAVLFRDVSSNVVPNASPTVTFSVTSGSCSVSGQPVSVNGSGVAALSASTLTVPSSAGSCIVHAVTSPAISGSPFDFRVVAAPAGAVVWSGLTDDNYASASNWIGGSVPTSASAVFIPRWMIRSPKMQASQTVASVIMETGSTFDVASANTLTVAGTIDAATITNGAVKATGTSSNIRGTFTAVALTFGDGTSACSYTLNGAATTTTGVPATSGNVALASCSVDVSSQTLTIGRDLTVTGANGKLVMQNASGKVTVAGSATFNGASTSSDLTAGNLEIAGNFSQQATVSTTSFAPSVAHTTKLNGLGAQSVAFADPTSSHFYNLNVTNSSFSGTTITSIAQVTNDFTLGASATFSGGAKKLVVGGAVSASTSSDLHGLDTLEVSGNTFPNLQNTTAGRAPKLTLLTGSAVVLSANRTVSGGLAIGTGGSLSIGAQTLTIKDSLIVTGILDMASPSGQLIVENLARFQGGSSSGHIQAGTLKVAGNFLEEGAASTAFAPASGFLVQLNGTFSQDVKFDHPGASSSRFANLDIINTSSSGVSFSTNVNVTGFLQQKGRLQISSSTTATVDGISEFKNGAITDVVGTFSLVTGNFYSPSHTTGSGTLTVQSCSFSFSLAGGDLLVGSGISTFNRTTCSVPGGGLSP